MARIQIAFLFCLTLVFAGGIVSARDLDKLYEKAKFRLGKSEFTAYLADNNERRADGLMFIKKLPAETGMLFIFEDETIQGFWMKNTLIPLSIGFFDAKGRLVDVQEMKVAESLVSKSIPSYQSKSPALFALEMNEGWFKKHKINLGTRLELRSRVKSEVLIRKLPAGQ